MEDNIITKTIMVINLRITHVVVVVVRTDHVVTIVAVVVPIADQDNHKPLFIILSLSATLNTTLNITII